MLRWLWVLLACAPLAAQNGSAVFDHAAVLRLPAPPVAERAALFAYDADAPFAVEIRRVEPFADGTVTDFSFATAAGRETPLRRDAYLVRPAGPPRALILWLHWLGDPETSQRGQFLAEAKALAAVGALSLLPDCRWRDPQWYRRRQFETDPAQHREQTVEILRALDYLRAVPGAADLPLGVVGHDYGAMHAVPAIALWAGRVDACVYAAPAPSFLHWAFYYGRRPADLDAYLAAMRPLELTDFLRVRAVATLVQLAGDDFYVPMEDGERFFNAVAGPRQLRPYPGLKHDLSAPQVSVDRAAWLARHLGLQ